MPNPFEGRANAEALDKKTRAYAQESIDAVLADRNAIIAALGEFDAEERNSNNVFDAICSKIEEQVILHLAQAHEIDISGEEEARRISDYDAEENTDIANPETISTASKADALSKLGEEYAGVDINGMIRETIGGDGGEESIDVLRKKLVD